MAVRPRFPASPVSRYVTTVERAGIEKGHRQGEANILLWQIEKKFGETSANALRERVASADSDTLRLWSERILTADTPDALFH
ncbi:MAG: transposase [Thiocapsa sp.]|uniref:transposase n=1 Tax=Thiocapsa sp. TaxID=2024551 RepID=UPI001BCBE07C|nr:transposase [Thiocapsa sp.]QVL50050.1 MAG: transposase [Thiocapsa sp.]